jgi:hypothetical protein
VKILAATAKSGFPGASAAVAFSRRQAKRGDVKPWLSNSSDDGHTIAAAALSVALKGPEMA